MSNISIKDRYLDLSKNFSEKTQREKIILVIVMVLVYVPYMYLVSPIDTKMKKMNNTKISLIDNIANSQNILNEQLLMLQRDPAEILNKKINVYRKKINDLDLELAKSTIDLVPAHEMPTVLTDLLKDTNGLRVISITNIAPEIVLKNEASNATLFKHGTHIVLEGSYLQTLKYIQLLENMDKKFIWGSLSYKVKEYPNGIVDIEVYTLSNSKDFIRG